ncbi:MULTISPECIES: YhcN/YlaJ family sporulation lipoprotein [unclassified Paenibacillus]|uniref:YhcN/YlaJ family sporulation lipoprotein n=1 Tax=unclassified Paenibacillus TaxID=185978 RepID=UPI0009542EAB|nr:MULTISPECIES: YhcN/YlaJ family sporulation lipoprotein [unclassified Paenibacillus]ASS65977.1 YhcN/YlaJ family sporulation lipoprotein [Paenibacillus sp. RUD330]SIQ16695.1 sporulation lipoprotein, YhcN/YlaJ family [Paenibacillus sp. RU4X]SIQ38674.1 sporulation lipoprotein, YhcN/YlaJ family [Paenibacillus sp. RU4T]
MKKWLSAALILCLTATGCGTVAHKGDSPSPAEDQRIRTKQTDPQPEKTVGSAQAAKRLEELASRVEGVRKAHAVVAGNTAVVGIDVDGSVDRSRVGTIKYAVAQALRNDPLGVRAIVTADMDVNQRLSELGADIRRGRPIQGFAEEMADIVGRIVPQLPRNTAPENRNAASPAPMDGMHKAGAPAAHR